MSAIPRPPRPRDVPRSPSGLPGSTSPPVRPVARAEIPPEVLAPGRGCECEPYPPRWRPRPRRAYLHRCPCCHVTRSDPSVKTWSCPRCAENGDDVPMEVVVAYLD